MEKIFIFFGVIFIISLLTIFSSFIMLIWTDHYQIVAMKLLFTALIVAVVSYGLAQSADKQMNK